MTTTSSRNHADDPFAGFPLLISVPRAAKLIGISRAAAYRFASAGDLPTKKLGRRVYVISAKLRTSSTMKARQHERSRFQARKAWAYWFDIDPDPLTGRRRQKTRADSRPRK